MKKTIKRKRIKPVRKSTVIKKSRGMSKMVVLAVVAIALAAVGGFFIFSKQSLPGTPTLFKAALNPNCELNDPELCKFMNNWKEMKQYSVTSVMTGEEGTMESMYEMSGDDKFRMTSSQDGKANYEMISIGKTTYTKDFTDNKWWKYTYEENTEEVTATEDFKESFDFDTEGETKDTTTYKSLGKEACGELTCFKYQIVDATFSGTQYMWFDDREYLLRKQSVEDEGTSTVSTFAYNNVNISEPSPVKEGSPYGGAAGGTLPEGYSEADLKEMMEQYQQDNTNTDSEMPVDDYSEEAAM